MTLPTTRTTSPAALPRSGRDRSALPNDPGLDTLLADPALGSTAKTIAIALVKHWAWYKDHCWPSDETIALKIGKSPGHVQRCLRQLELAGWVHREHTSEVPSGRRIWLLWRRSDAGQGARQSSASARTRQAAPARSEQNVVVEQEEAEPEEVRSAPRRQRPEVPATAIPTPTVEVPGQATGKSGQVARPDLPPALTFERTDPPTPPPTAPPQGPVMATRPRVTDRPTGARFPVPVSQETSARTTTAPSPPPTPAIPPSGLRVQVPAFQRAPVPARTTIAPSPPSTPAILPNHGMSPVVLTGPEQARLRELPEPAREQVLRWLATGDKICVGEARKLLAPTPPPEPPPCALPTAELLSGLPGRPDRVATAAGRLAAELRDPHSFNYYRSVADAVCARQQPAEVLVSAWRQGTSPKAARPGAVFATAWKRETEVMSPS